VDTAYLSAIVGLAGVAIGALSSFATTWLTQWAQLRDKNREAEHKRREELYAEVIMEATRLYADALSHEKDDVTDLVKLYALIAKLRLTSSDRVVHAAEHAMAAIIDTYLAPNRTLHEMRLFAKEGGMNFLLEFGEACREELARIAPVRRRV